MVRKRRRTERIRDKDRERQLMYYSKQEWAKIAD